MSTGGSAVWAAQVLRLPCRTRRSDELSWTSERDRVGRGPLVRSHLGLWLWYSTFAVWSGQPGIVSTLCKGRLRLPTLLVLDSTGMLSSPAWPRQRRCWKFSKPVWSANPVLCKGLCLYAPPSPRLSFKNYFRLIEILRRKVEVSQITLHAYHNPPTHTVSTPTPPYWSAGYKWQVSIDARLPKVWSLHEGLLLVVYVLWV